MSTATSTDDGSYDYVWLLLVLLSIYGAYKLLADLTAKFGCRRHRALELQAALPEPAARPTTIAVTANPRISHVVYSADGLKNGICHFPGIFGKLKCAVPSKIIRLRVCQDSASNTAKGRQPSNG